MFRILIVDDDPAAAYVIKAAMGRLTTRPQLHTVGNGTEALDFLHRRNGYRESVRPDLILLDVNMPSLGGIETLSAIKEDPELRVIPVIMFSTSTSPADVRMSYHGHANAYVRKPDSFERFVQIAQALEAFWIASVHPFSEARVSLADERGDYLATDGTHDLETLREKIDAMGKESRGALEHHPAKSSCPERDQLSADLAAAVLELVELQVQQLSAIVESDSEFHRFDVLTHLANEKKQHAKYAFLRHTQEHACVNARQSISDHAAGPALNAKAKNAATPRNTKATT